MGKLGATVAIVGVLGVVVAFALRSGNAGKVMSPAAPAQPHTEAAAPPRPAPVGPGPVHVNTPSGTSVAAWNAKFDSADDYLRFVKEALPAAQAGDGRAAYYIGAALSYCLLVMQNYHNSADPEAQLQQELTELARGKPGVRKKALPQWVIDQREHETRRCLGLAKEGAPGGYSSDYWNAKALAAGDPLAQVDVVRSAAGDLIDPQMSSETVAAKLKVIQDNLRAVVESGDPDALWQAGVLMASPRFTDDTSRAIAVALAACELGHDCRESGCGLTDACPDGADFAYILQRDLGQERYAQLWARAQQVVQLERAGDYQGVLAYLTIDKPL